MKLIVDSEACCKCGVCSSWFPGMPEDAYGGITVPKWAEHCMRAGHKLLLSQCPNEAIHLDEE